MSAIEIRPPRNAQEIKQIEEVQRRTWNADDLWIMPSLIMHAVHHAGGLILCAFDGEQMVGFSLGFLGTSHGKRMHWSHMTGVVPEYQRQRVGYQLKLAQRQHVLAQGFDTIGWTYDPMRKQNAVFNLATLGAKVVDLYPEHYGKMDDGINRGLLSDRFEVHWHLKQEPPASPPAYINPADAHLYLVRMQGIAPQVATFDESPDILVELPADIDALRMESPETAHDWYHVLRDTYFSLTKQHYSIEGVFIPSPETFAYVFQRESEWFLYVVEAADGSYYTGIARDVERRVQQHNTGKGAKYTAMRRPVKLAAAWKTYGRSSALKLEYAFKQLTRPQKARLIEDKQANFQDAVRVF